MEASTVAVSQPDYKTSPDVAILSIDQAKPDWQSRSPMPIDKPKYRFTKGMVAGAPEATGIYALWENGEMIYIGRAVRMSIREALLLHLEKGYCPCTEVATHYTWELSFQPATREVEVLEGFKARHGRIPRCNEDAA